MLIFSLDLKLDDFRGPLKLLWALGTVPLGKDSCRILQYE